jgi:hypothetical protein
MTPRNLEETARPADGGEVRLQGQLLGRVLEFRLVPRERGLVLQGRARTYHAKQLAQHAVRQATALPILANEIEVF